MTEEEKIQKIDDFLNSRLPEVESVAFQQNITEDASLNEEVEMHRLMLAGIMEDANIDKLKLHLQALENEYRSGDILQADQLPGKTRLQKPVIRMHPFRWITGIAATLLICLLGYYTFTHQGGTSKLYREYYQPYPMVEVLPSSGRGSAAQTDREQGLHFYENGQYDQVIRLLAPYLPHHPDVAASFYLGVAYLHEDKTAEAIVIFKSIHQMTSNDYKQPATWYLALTYLKDNQPLKAIPYLDYLKRQKGEFSERAGTILDEIKTN